MNKEEAQKISEELLDRDAKNLFDNAFSTQYLTRTCPVNLGECAYWYKEKDMFIHTPHDTKRTTND